MHIPTTHIYTHVIKQIMHKKAKLGHIECASHTEEKMSKLQIF